MVDEVPIIRKKKEDPEERVKIILERNDRIPRNGLNVGHNGTNYLIQPGVPVSVPRKVVNVLKDARGSFPVYDPVSNTLIGFEDRSIYPFTYAE